MAYQSLEEILDYCEAHNRKFYEAVMDDDCQERTVTEEESRQQMYAMCCLLYTSDAADEL